MEISTKKEIIEFLEERAIMMHFMAREEAEMWQRDKPSNFVSAHEREKHTSEVNRLFSKSFEFLDLADHYKLIARKL